MSRAESVRTVGASGHIMRRHLSFVPLLLLLLLLGCACGSAYAENNAWEGNTLRIVAGRTKVPEKLGVTNAGGSGSGDDVSSFASPFLVGGNGVMAVLAEARYTKNVEEGVDVVARYIETDRFLWSYMTNHDYNGGTQLALQGKKERDHHSALKSPTAVLKGNKIYLLALNNRGPDGLKTFGRWHFGLSVGEITGEVGSKTIKWGPSESLRSKLTQEINRKGLSVFPGSSHSNSAFLTSQGTIVFSASAKNKEGELGFAVMQLKDDEEQWEVSFVEKPKECGHLFLFEWKGKLIRMFSGCSTDARFVMEYDEMAKRWRDADTTLFHGWSSMHRSKDFTPATIGNKSLLLFTEGCSLAWSRTTCSISLFFTDGNRVYGPERIDTKSSKAVSQGLLYTNGQLFFMYQVTDKGLGKIVVKRLREELEKFELVLKNWDEKDAYISKRCSETAPEGASPDTLCVTPMPTDGLVGFFANKGHDRRWHDHYNFRNAAVNGGSKVKNGYTFTEAYQGADWLINDRPAGVWHNFTKCGFTVMATMTLHETPTNDAPLLTVYVSKKRLGLWYKGKQWKVVSTNGNEEPTVDLKIQKEHRVALILHNNAISVYVDGKSLGGPLPISAPGEKPFVIENVVIGARWFNGKINMTVTDVLLYKRPLNGTELEATSRTIATATSTETKETPETVTDSKEKVKAPINPAGKPTPFTGIRKKRETPTDSKRTPEDPTVPKEDSSEHMYVGASLLFLLGLQAVAVFFSASI